MSINWDTVMSTLHAWVVEGSGLAATKVVWGQQSDAPRPDWPAIIMKIYVLDDQGGGWLDFKDNPLTFADKTVSAVSGNNLTITSHGLLTGDGPVRIASTGDLPTPLEADTDYWVIRVDANDIRLAATFVATGGGNISNPVTPITLTDAGTGTITIADTADTLRVGAEMQAVARGYYRLGLELICYNNVGAGALMPTSILSRIVTRMQLPAMQTILDSGNLGFQSVDRVRSMLGIRDTVMFEPRAWVNIQFSLPYEETADQTIIQRIDLHDETQGTITRIPDP